MQGARTAAERERHAREERGARHADRGVGRTQRPFGLLDVRTVEEHFARHPFGQSHLEGRSEFDARRQELFGNRSAHEELQRVAVHGDGALIRGDRSAGGGHRRAGLLVVELAHGAEAEALLDEAEAFFLAGERFTLQLQLFDVGAVREPRHGDLADERALGGTAGVVGGQIVLQSLLVEVAHAPEEVDFVTRHRKLRRVLVARTRASRRGKRFGRVLRRILRGGGHGREEFRALHAVKGAGALDVERRNAQVAVVFQTEVDHLFEAFVHDEVLPDRKGRPLRFGRRIRLALRPGAFNGRRGALVIGRKIHAARQSQEKNDRKNRQLFLLHVCPLPNSGRVVAPNSLSVERGPEKVPRSSKVDQADAPSPFEGVP